MRLVGAAERGMQMMTERALQRKVFGKLIAEQGSFLSDIAKVTPAIPNCFFKKYLKLHRILYYGIDLLGNCPIIFTNLLNCLQCRVELEKTRLLVLEAADQLDRLGNKKARGTIAMAKVLCCCNSHVFMLICISASFQSLSLREQRVA